MSRPNRMLVVVLVTLVAACAVTAEPAPPKAADAVADAPWYEKVPGPPVLSPEEQARREERIREGVEELLPETPSPLTRESAFGFLLNADVSATFIGPGDAMSGQVDAINVILAQPDASSAFHSMLRRARLPGQMFALCGLYLTDRAAYERAVKPYRGDRRRVRRVAGCLIERVSVAEMVPHIDSGAWPNALREAGGKSSPATRPAG